MTDRTIVYDTAIPQAGDILNTSKMAMLGDAFLAMATLGNSATAPSVVAAGLACTPTSPASLQVNVGPGAIFQLDTVDATGYSDLGTDSNQIYKMGIRETLGTLTVTPPSTSGFSQVFLVQAILSDVDTGSLVLSYYNSANPSVPFSGPGNAGTSQPTQRTCVCTVALKAGVAAATGSQVTPAPDAGYTGLYAITVANGQTTITSPNIAPLNGGFAPFVNTALPYIPVTSQSGVWTYGPDTGTLNNLIVALNPKPAALTVGMQIRVKMLHIPTGATVINCGFGNNAIVKTAGAPLTGAEWAAGDIVPLTFDGTNWQILYQGSAGGRLTVNTTIYVNGAIGNDSNDGTANTAGHALATVQAAINLAFNYAPSQFSITIQIADGTYTGGNSTPGYAGPNLIINGDATTPANVLISAGAASAFVVSGPNTMTVQNLKFQTGTSSGPSRGCVALNGASMITSNTISNAVQGGVFTASGGASLNVGSHTFQGNSDSFFEASAGGTIRTAGSASFVIGAALSVTTGAANANENGTIIIQSPTASWSGSGVTGPRYSATLNGTINTGGAGSTYFPGSSAGSAASGGQYV